MPRDSLAELERRMKGLSGKLNRPAKRGQEAEHVLVHASEAPNVYFLRRPSGIIELDLDTGGGIPAGGLVYLSGPDGAGKTFLVHKYFAMAQRLYRDKARICYVASEGQLDHFRMRQTGIEVAVPDENLDELDKARKERGETPLTKAERASLQTEVGEVKLLRHNTAETVLSAVLDCVESKAFDIIAVDSISALIPEAEAGKDLDEHAQQAAAANVLTRFFLHYLPTTTGFRGVNETTLIFVSQVRSNRKRSEAASHIQKYIKEWSPQGAWAARHGKLIDICVWGSSPEKETQTEQVMGLGGPSRQAQRVAVRKTMHWQILKGKAGTHDGITGEVDYNYAVPPFTDDPRNLILAGLSKGVILEKEGTLTFHRGPKQEADPQFRQLESIEHAIHALKSDFELELALRREVLFATGIRCLYR